MNGVLVRAEHLTKHYAFQGSAAGAPAETVRAADDISLDLPRGASFGVVGETGSGKSTLGLLLLGLTAPTGGEVYFSGKALSQLSRSELRLLRREMQMVFQDPDSTLNPRRTVEQSVTEPLLVQRICSGAEAKNRTIEVMAKVGLGRHYLSRYPHQLSGGQKQRVAIARALITGPQFIVLDEPTSALDVSMQARILGLLREIRAERDLTYLFISHDLSVVRHICDFVAVMYLGKIVEVASTQQLFSRPQHPYTQLLLSSVPEPDPRHRRLVSGGRPTAALPARFEYPAGCRFHTRCPFAMDECRTREPPLLPVEGSASVACHLVHGAPAQLTASELPLAGVGGL